MKELVSVIIPVYNSELFIKRCIESIMNQTYKNLQIIIINDGSTDKSHSICKELKTNDNRIEYIIKENGGAGSAKNVGLDNARGEYISFVDSDDFIKSDYIEYLLFLSKEYDSEITQVSYIFGSGERFPNRTQKEFVRVHKNNEIFFSKDYKSVVWGKLYKSSLFKNIRFILDRKIDDETIIYKLYYRTNKVIFSNLEKYYYYQSSNSIMRSEVVQIDYGFMKTFRERIEYFTKKENQRLVDISILRMCFSILRKLSRNKLTSGLDYSRLIEVFREKSSLIIRSKEISKIDKLILRLGRITPRLLIFLLSIKNR